MSQTLTVFPAATDAQVERYQPPALPEAPVTAALGQMTEALQAGTVALDEQAAPFSCIDHLSTRDRAIAQRQAGQLLSQIMTDSNVVVTYGLRQLQPVNDLVRQLLESEGRVSLPELDARMRELRTQLRVIQGRSAPDPRTAAFYTKWKNAFLAKLHMIRDSWEMLQDDVKSLSQHIDDLEAMIAAAQRELRAMVASKDVYYDKNEKEITGLFGIVATMEAAAKLAADQAAAIKIDADDPLNRGSEQQARLAKIAADLKTRISNLDVRLMLAFSTSVDIRGSRDLDVALALLLSDLRYITVPTLRATAWKWMQAKKSQMYAEEATAVTGFANDAVRMYGEAAVGSAQVVAATVNTPLLNAQTIVDMSAVLDRIADVVVAAMQSGQTQQLANRRAITQGVGILQGAAEKVSAETVREVLEQVGQVGTPANPIPPGFATKVISDPASVGVRVSSDNQN